MRAREDLTVEPYCSTLGFYFEGGVLYEPSYSNLEISNPSERFETDLVLARKAREDLIGKPYCSTLAFSLKGGGVLYESSSPDIEASNPSERFVTDLVLAIRSQGRILITDLILSV